MTTLQRSSASDVRLAAKKADADESRFGSWRRKIDSSDERLVLELEYTSGHDTFGPDEYREFTDFHRKLVGAIEQPMVIE